MKTSLLSLLLAISLFCSAHEGGNFVSSDMLASMKPGEKAALLMVHFGTTHDDTRAQTIDAVNAQQAANRALHGDRGMLVNEPLGVVCHMGGGLAGLVDQL